MSARPSRLVWRKERGPLAKVGTWDWVSSVWVTACGSYRIVRDDRWSWLAVSPDEDDWGCPRIFAHGMTLRECKANTQEYHRSASRPA